MVQLKIISADSDARPLGSIQWFAVHPTSMNNTNRLVSSDNVGFASVLWETKMNNNTFPGKVSNYHNYILSILSKIIPSTLNTNFISLQN